MNDLNDDSGRLLDNGPARPPSRPRRLAAGAASATAWLLAAAALGGAPASANVHHKPARSTAKAAARPASAASAAAAGAAAGTRASAPAAANATSTDLSQWCALMAAQVPGLAQPACQATGLVAGDGRSVRGVPLWTRDVLPAGAAPRFKVLLLGGIHGDELASVTLVFDWIARIQGIQAQPRATRSPTADVAWRFVPLLNPDGLLHAPSTRVNAHGVDLNRNFPTADWARDAQPYWVQRTRSDPRRFPGTQPLSEPESSWLLKQIEAFHPDLIVSVHAPYGLLDFDGPPPVPRRLGSLQLDPVGVYPGSLGNYGGLVKQVPVMTLELKNARQVPPRELAAMWNDLQRWIDQRMAKAGTEAGAAKGAAPVTKRVAGNTRSARRLD